MPDLTPETLAELRRRHAALTPFALSFLTGGPGGDPYIALAAEDGSQLTDAGFDAVLLFAEMASDSLPALLDAAAERDALRTWQERVALAAGLADEVAGYGVHLEADPDTAAEHVAGLLDIADTHVECPIYCGDCGEPLADTPCDHCGGSGCGPGTGSGAYEECGWCAGAGKVHVGCAHLSYAELCAELDALAAKLDVAIDVTYLDRQQAWSAETFGPAEVRGHRGVLDHIRKELVEIEAEPGDVTEWADLIILAFDGAWRSGHSPADTIAAIKAKQERNEARTWPDWRTADPDKAIEHVRALDTTPDTGGES